MVLRDRRLTPVNSRVAAAHLASEFPDRRAVRGEPMQVARPLVDLCDAPNGARARQLLLGDFVRVHEYRAGWAFVHVQKDGYVGYLPEAALSPREAPSHWVAAPATHVYPSPDIKTREGFVLSLGARVTARSERGAFVETGAGFIPRIHLRRINDHPHDWIEVARSFLHTPYLWGGNSSAGIDCSGLVQTALLACAIACPGDSDQQQRLGSEVRGPLRRGDLVFWKGHVGLIAGPDLLLHANAHHMAVTEEPLAAACARIRAAGGGPMIARRRPRGSQPIPPRG